MYTTHGHQIPGTEEDPSSRPLRVAKCGGVGFCNQCNAEAKAEGHVMYTPSGVRINEPTIKDKAVMHVLEYQKNRSEELSFTEFMSAVECMARFLIR